MNQLKQLNLVPGIAIRKANDLAQLTELVDKAQYKVTQQQAIVDSLTAKSAQFSAFLAQATDGRASALANFNLVKDALANVESLATNVESAHTKSDSAAAGATQVSGKLSTLIAKLVFAVEMIGKAEQLINRQRVVDTTIPDSLGTVMGSAASAADSAIAQTLAALKSAYAAESTLIEAAAAVRRGAGQARDLRNDLRQGWDDNTDSPAVSDAALSEPKAGNGVVVLLARAYRKAVDAYDHALRNNDSVTAQLTHARLALADATTAQAAAKLSLNAATAAAFAA